MKLNLSKEWIEKHLSGDEDEEVGACNPAWLAKGAIDRKNSAQESESEIAEAHAFGALVQLLRRDRNLTLEQLAAELDVSSAELVAIECEPRYLPKAQAVLQLSKFFGLPDHSLMKLANVVESDSEELRRAAVRFAAGSSKVADLSSEERVALTEFVQFLSSEGSKP